MKKKILIFSLAYYPKHIGGAEVAIKEITNRVSSEKYEFHVLCNRYDSTLPRSEQIGNVYVHRIGITTKAPTMSDLRRWPLHINKFLYQFLAYYVAKRLHREHNFSATWAMMAHACGVPAGRFKSTFSDIPYVLTLQEGDPPEQIEKTMRWFGAWFKNAFTSADVVQSISTFLAQWAAKQGFVGRSVVIPNAVNIAHFTQECSEEELQTIRAELGKRTHDVFLVTTSRLVTKNAVDDVIKALALLPSHVKFVVFGVGPDESILQQLAKEQGVADRVQFRGQISHDVMPKYLKACDIFIRPSRSEGMGNSFVEAMAAGLPVIATQVGGLADFLFDTIRNPDKQPTGWAVDPDCPEQIKTAVDNILSDPATTDQVIDNARDLVRQKYDWDLIAARMQAEVFDPLFTD